MPEYEFFIGDIDDGGIGLSAKVQAEDASGAVRSLKEFLKKQPRLVLHGAGGHGEAVRRAEIFLRINPISRQDICDGDEQAREELEL